MTNVTYSVYNVKDEMPIIISGTVKECAKACGLKISSFKSMASRQRHGKPKNGSKRKYFIIRDDPMEDE